MGGSLLAVLGGLGATVLSSQFAALTAVAAYVIHGQRLSRSQLAGLAAVVAGVSLLSALGA